jgi:hypothetical protein
LSCHHPISLFVADLFQQGELMKIASIIVIIFAVVLLAVIAIRAQSSKASNVSEAEKGSSDPKEVYAGLRHLALTGSRSKLGLAPTSNQNEPWGVMMDWGLQKGTATIVAMSDGSASVYFSSGGGYLGGKGQEPIRIAAERAVNAAKLVQLPRSPVVDFPIPGQHEVSFYLLTDAGVFMFRTSEQELSSHEHPLRKLGDSMQEVITQYRLWDERRKSESE